MKNILLILLFLSKSNVFAQAIFYDGPYGEALQYAHSQKKEVILLFGNKSCGPCIKLKKDFFGNKEIGAFLNKYFVIKEINAIVKIENNKYVYENTFDGELSKKYDVTGFPHIEILNVDDVSNPKAIAAFIGLDFSKIDKSKEYNQNHFPIQLNETELNKNDGKDKYEFRLDIIKRMFEKYTKK